VNRPNLDTDRIRALTLVGGMIAVMWVVEVVNAVSNYSLNYDLGLRPHHVGGLDGILFSPFLHGSWSHLVGNTVPFAILGGVIALSGLARVILVTAIVALVGGVGTWLVASGNSVHVGASGLVFGYAAYLVGRGVFTRSLLHLGVGVVVGFVWGGTLLSGLAPQDGISWQGHLFGAVGGFVAAYYLGKRTAARKPPPPPAGGPTRTASGSRKTPEQLLEELKAV
jgi:membrane associated rhomboid family serine protease